MLDICPSAQKCPIFTGILKNKSFTTKTYKSQYCEAGIEGRDNCKRWQYKNKFGKVPETLLPNATESLEKIAQRENY
ncbi:MAG TPA: hypothetical protein VFC68_00330 [Treponemataceae bacterium]|nr:hypothetical protein [Treponemataceae bacterium]